MKVLVVVNTDLKEQFEDASFDLDEITGRILEVRSTKVGEGSPLLAVFRRWKYVRYID